MLAAGADTIVLGCTHYPFVIEAIRRLVGPALGVLDPAPAVARYLGEVLKGAGLLNAAPGRPQHRFLTSGESKAFDRALARLVGACGVSERLGWYQGHLQRL